MKGYQGEPCLAEKMFGERFKPNSFIFICDMIDLMADNIPLEYIKKVLSVAWRNPKSTFLVLTKNPKRYLELLELDRLANYTLLPTNIILGATIETDLTEFNTPSQYKHYAQISHAPIPPDRLYWFTHVLKVMLERRRKLKLFISIEPILDFDGTFKTVLYWFHEALYGIAVGYDNYFKSHPLPEPSLDKTLELINSLENSGITIFRKTLRKAWWENEKMV